MANDTATPATRLVDASLRELRSATAIAEIEHEQYEDAFSDVYLAARMRGVPMSQVVDAVELSALHYNIIMSLDRLVALRHAYAHVVERDCRANSAPGGNVAN